MFQEDKFSVTRNCTSYRPPDAAPSGYSHLQDDLRAPIIYGSLVSLIPYSFLKSTTIAYFLVAEANLYLLLHLPR